MKNSPLGSILDGKSPSPIVGIRRAQGWRKKLNFSPDGALKDFSREYWGLSS